METSNQKCAVCENTSQDVPLLVLTYQGKNYYVCSTHLPLLIHHPERLAGILPGAENLRAGEH